MTPDEALASLTAALDEAYPGEFLDPAALRVVVDGVAALLRRCDQLDQRAGDGSHVLLRTDDVRGILGGRLVVSEDGRLPWEAWPR